MNDVTKSLLKKIIDLMIAINAVNNDLFQNIPNQLIKFKKMNDYELLKTKNSLMAILNYVNKMPTLIEPNQENIELVELFRKKKESGDFNDK